jgi:uncharacterized phage-associated protein
MESPKAVANFFIKRSFDTGIELSPMKLLKLVYLAHGWHLGFFKEDLIDEPVEAWRYGPVVKSVYHQFKDYGDEKIDKFATQIEGLSKEMVSFKYVAPEVADNNKLKKLLNVIWESYKNHSGLQLSSITHQPGSPWDIVWNQQGGKDKKSAIIGNDIIKEYYIGRVAALPAPITFD